MSGFALDQVTRVEVIDSFGRAYTQHEASNVEMTLQDDGRTLKVFLTAPGPIRSTSTDPVKEA